MSKTYRVGLGAGVVVGLLCAAGSAVAEQRPGPTAIEGHVIELQGSDILLDLAHQRGATDGAVVELWRPLSVKHPVTGEQIKDRFLIGKLRLVQVRDALSLSRPDGKLARDAQTGDIVILRSARGAAGTQSSAAVVAPGTTAAPILEPTKPDAAPCNEATAAASGCDADTAAVSALFDGLRGQSPRTRILAYEGYVKRRPKGRYAVVLYEEAQQLRKLLRLLNAAQPVELSPTPRSFEPPVEALAGTPLEFGLELDNAVGAVFHSRHAGEVAYATLPMQPAGDGYFTVQLPAQRSLAPRLDYFIEAITPSGRAVAVVASADSPRKLTVNAVPTPKPPARRDSIVSISTDYADWNNWKGNDVVWQTEGFVGMRLADEGVRSVHMGFGVLRGVGGSLQELDELKLGGRAVGLTYGYLEGELGVSHFIGIIGRLVIGLEDDGVSGGAQGLLRIGNDRETNLQIGGEVLGSVGLRGITQLELNSFPKFPVMFRTEVTNQPAGWSRRGEEVRPSDPNLGQELVSHERGEVGARAIAQIGYRLLPALVVAVRGSYQGRTINHAGPGVGGAVSYQW